MSSEKILKDAKNGDITAFTQLYAAVYKKIYYVAYYSLVNGEEAAKTLKNAANAAYENIDGCRNAADFERLFLKKACEQIVERYRDYRKNPPKLEVGSTFIKSKMNCLTDAERLSVAIWSVFGFGSGDISKATGLAADVVAKKLESGQSKLEAKL